jgi:hypothetical protein
MKDHLALANSYEDTPVTLPSKIAVMQGAAEQAITT